MEHFYSPEALRVAALLVFALGVAFFGVVAQTVQFVRSALLWLREDPLVRGALAIVLLVFGPITLRSKNFASIRPPQMVAAPLPAEPMCDVVSVSTNGVAFRAASSNAVEIAAFRQIGGTELGEWIDADAPFFAIGTNPVSRCYVAASGSVSFESMRRNHSANVGYSNPRYEIQEYGDTIWTSLPSDNWTARIAGTFLVRGKAEVAGKEIMVGPITIWVQFPSETEMIADPAIQAKAAELWSRTLNACTPTSRQEFGCWIRLDTSTDTYSFSETIPGPETSNDQVPNVPLGNNPPSDTPVHPNLSDGSAIYTVGSFHTHTPTTYLSEDEPRPAGPSEPDKHSSTNLHMPGFVYDYTEATEGAGIPMGHPMNAAARLYPIEACTRRDE